MRNEDYESQDVNFHIVNPRRTIASDASDKTKFQEILTLCVNSFKHTAIPKGISNIVTGQILLGPDKVNIDNVTNIGQTQMVLCESGWAETLT